MPREKLDPFWHRSRVAARIWLKAQQGKPLSPRDRRLARLFADDRGVTDRLIEQARTYWTAPFTLNAERQFQPRTRCLVVPSLELGDSRWKNVAKAVRNTTAGS